MSDQPSLQLPPELERGDAFMRLLLAHERRIYGLILALIPRWSDADDVMQETTSVLWRKFDEFEPGTNFAAWAFRIARFQVLAFRKRQRRSGAQLSDEIIEQAADKLLADAEQPDHRRDALQGCLERLTPRDRELVQLRYTPGANTHSVAEQVARSTDAVYKALNRIHSRLLDCVRLKLSAEGRAMNDHPHDHPTGEPFDKDRLDELLGALRDDALSDEDVAELESLLDSDPAALARYVEYAQLCAHLRQWQGEGAGIRDQGPGKDLEPRTAHTYGLTVESSPGPRPLTPGPFPRWLWLAAATVTALAASLVLWLQPPHEELRPNFTDEGGLAILTQAAGAQWGEGQSFGVGSPLHKGTLELKAGLAQIEFFRGAVVILEGPARLELVADDRAILHHGTLRSHVPPPAQGFVIETPQARLIDHGTEFGLSVNEAGDSEVHVFEGKVELQGAVAHQLTAGQGVRFNGAGMDEAIAVRPESFQGPAALAKTSDAEVLRRRSVWAAHAAQLARDPSAVAYFTFEHPDAWGRTLKDESPHGRDAAIVGSQWSEGRWPGKGALEFKRTGDRVRIDVPDTFAAFTLVTWLRIDGFDRWLSSPLLTDTYSEGRPHWHVTWDGEIVLGIGHDGNYFSPKGLLGAKDLGRWIHLATVVDPVAKTVTHYLDGQAVHQAPLRKVQQFRIAGPAGVGNWSRPGVAKDTDVRSLNGRMDEFGIFGRAFTPDEIRTMYEQGKPTS